MAELAVDARPAPHAGAIRLDVTAVNYAPIDPIDWGDIGTWRTMDEGGAATRNLTAVGQLEFAGDAALARSTYLQASGELELVGDAALSRWLDLEAGAEVELDGSAEVSRAPTDLTAEGALEFDADAALRILTRVDISAEGALEFDGDAELGFVPGLLVAVGELVLSGSADLIGVRRPAMAGRQAGVRTRLTRAR